MTPALAAALLWVLAANVAALLPAERARPRALVALVAVGVPLLGWLTLAHGPWVGLAAFAVGAALLRWPPLALRPRRLPPGPPPGPAE